MKINRRDFIKILGSAVAATILSQLPIPKLSEKRDVSGCTDWEPTTTVSTSGGVLTPEMIEEAALIASQKHGKPDLVYIWFSDDKWKELVAQYPKLKSLEMLNVP